MADRFDTVLTYDAGSGVGEPGDRSVDAVVMNGVVDGSGEMGCIYWLNHPQLMAGTGCRW